MPNTLPQPPRTTPTFTLFTSIKPHFSEFHSVRFTAPVHLDAHIISLVDFFTRWAPTSGTSGDNHDIFRLSQHPCLDCGLRYLGQLRLWARCACRDCGKGGPGKNEKHKHVLSINWLPSGTCLCYLSGGSFPSTISPVLVSDHHVPTDVLFIIWSVWCIIILCLAILLVLL